MEDVRIGGWPDVGPQEAEEEKRGCQPGFSAPRQMEMRKKEPVEGPGERLSIT